MSRLIDQSSLFADLEPTASFCTILCHLKIIIEGRFACHSTLRPENSQSVTNGSFEVEILT